MIWDILNPAYCAIENAINVQYIRDYSMYVETYIWVNGVRFLIRWPKSIVICNNRLDNDVVYFCMHKINFFA